MSELSRRPLLATLLVVLAMALSACAAAHRPSGVRMEPTVKTLPRPVDKAAARQQLDDYMRQLVVARRALGLEATDAGPSVVPAPTSRRRAKARDATSSPGQVQRPARRLRQMAPTAGASNEAYDGGARYAPRCPMPCKHARAICHAARRICKLADYLAEDDARERCDQARQDCREARETTQSRCRTCPVSPA
ncbi:MAG: hypothetical protein CSA65_05730 [Proteobacteria bacterium]|nr:MAG: hypothetical protein CSB49_02060 [Pseudomonadota bacterium]PIE18217.1 MAG: hypothetical protein CSA65_05730 [Pseudomonadota bacterium]